MAELLDAPEGCHNPQLGKAFWEIVGNNAYPEGMTADERFAIELHPAHCPACMRMCLERVATRRRAGAPQECNNPQRLEYLRLQKVGLSLHGITRVAFIQHAAVCGPCGELLLGNVAQSFVTQKTLDGEFL